MLKSKFWQNKSFIVSLICIFVLSTNCTVYRNMRPTGEYTTIDKMKMKEIYTFRSIQFPKPENPSLAVEFGKFSVYEENRKVKYAGKKKNITSVLLGTAMVAGSIPLLISSVQAQSKGDSSNLISSGYLLGFLGLFLLMHPSVKGVWTPANNYNLQKITNKDVQHFEPISTTKIRVSAPGINKEWQFITDVNGRMVLDLAEIAPLVRDGTDLLLTFQALDRSKASINFTISSAFFSSLKTYYASIRPPNLSTKVTFNDATSWKPNLMIDGAEKAFLVVTIENRGEGKALDVKLNIANTNSMISLRPDLNIGTIEPGKKVEQKIQISAAMDIVDGKTTFTVYTKEQRGYDAKPFQLNLNVRHLDKPALTYTSFKLNDGTAGMANGNGNGIVENGEMVEITAFIKNAGVGASLNTVVNLNSVSPGAEIRQGKVRLGTIAPTETKQAKVVVAIPRTYSGSDLRLTFVARDMIGASQITKEHILPMSKLAPILAFDSRFLDNRGVQVDEVSNGNNYILEIVPRNEGQIAARSVQANVTTSAGVNMTNSFATVGNIAVGAMATPIRFNFTLPRNYNYGIPQFNLRLSQSDFADVNQKLDIAFRLKSPNLIAREIVTTTDGNADIQQSETVDIDLVVENQGDLDAEGVVAVLNFTHTGIDFRERSKILGRIPASGQGRARFSFLVKTGAMVGPLVGQLQVRQADGFLPISKTLNYSINAIGAQIVTVTPTEQPGAAQRITPVVRANTEPVVFLSLKNLGAEGKSYDPYVKLEIQIKDDKPMLAVEPEIRVNGKLQPKDQGLRGIDLQERQSKEVDQKIRLNRQVELSEGLNNIEVRIYDSDNEMGFETVQVEYIPQRMDILALVIGIGEYQSGQIEPLKYATKDAQSFHDFLRSPEGGGLQSERIRLLLNKEATRENILKNMEWLASHAFENDLVIIYMAMHGIVDQNELYFVGYNCDPQNLLATGVKKSDLDVLQRRLKSKKVVWFADACHSGSLGEDTQITMRANRANATNRLLSEISKARNGLALFLSAQSTEFSQEGGKWGGGHGVFTYYLLQGLRGQADRNQDTYVSLLELYDFVSRQVGEATNGKQNPVLRGDFDRELKLSTIK